jgi:NADH-quinone oxidoreductase subunit A
VDQVLSAALTVALVAATIALVARWLGGPQGADVSGPEATPFLGGAEPRTHAWSRFHARYYPMTLLFIAFEMEMMFMYPWAIVFVHEGVKALADMGVFLGVLSLGILYGWRERVFEWQ